ASATATPSAGTTGTARDASADSNLLHNKPVRGSGHGQNILDRPSDGAALVQLTGQRVDRRVLRRHHRPYRTRLVGRRGRAQARREGGGVWAPLATSQASSERGREPGGHDEPAQAGRATKPRRRGG